MRHGTFVVPLKARQLTPASLALPSPKLVAIARLVVENLLKYGILINSQTLGSYLRFDILIWLLRTSSFPVSLPPNSHILQKLPPTNLFTDSFSL